MYLNSLNLLISIFTFFLTDPCITSINSYCELDENQNISYFIDVTYNQNCLDNIYDLVVVGGTYPNNFTADIITDISHFQQHIEIQNVIPNQTYQLYWGLSGSFTFPISYIIEPDEDMQVVFSDEGCEYSPNIWSCCPEVHNEYEDGGFDDNTYNFYSDFIENSVSGSTILYPSEYTSVNNSTIGTVECIKSTE